MASAAPLPGVEIRHTEDVDALTLALAVAEALPPPTRVLAYHRTFEGMATVTLVLEGNHPLASTSWPLSVPRTPEYLQYQCTALVKAVTHMNQTGGQNFIRADHGVDPGTNTYRPKRKGSDKLVPVPGGFIKLNEEGEPK